MKRVTARRLLACTALCAATPAWAQDTDNEGFLGVIRIGSPEAQALLGNDTVTEEEIEGRNPSTIADVFDGESSVTVSGGASLAQKVFVNGIEESLLSVTIDGARQNKSAFHHAGNVLLDPELLKQVEISRGLEHRRQRAAGHTGRRGAPRFQHFDEPDKAHHARARQLRGQVLQLHLHQRLAWRDLGPDGAADL